MCPREIGVETSVGVDNGVSAAASFCSAHLVNHGRNFLTLARPKGHQLRSSDSEDRLDAFVGPCDKVSHASDLCESDLGLSRVGAFENSQGRGESDMQTSLTTLRPGEFFQGVAKVVSSKSRY